MAQGICRQCCKDLPHRPDVKRCPFCGSPRVLHHTELDALHIAHIDCDAFYANVEKRDNPDLADRPVIVGGGRRGVVTAACYVARLYGVRSAMPMFKALKACPEAVVIRPDMKKYARIGRTIRDMMRAVTPLVEPLSIDEAFLDLSGTERLHRAPAALTLAGLANRIEDEVGLTVSIGLSYNKFLAKIASDLDKPRGFAVLGRAESLDFLNERPISTIWGVGKALKLKLNRDGLTRIGQLCAISEQELVAGYGSIGHRLYAFSRGQDERRVNPDSPTKTISSETTFEHDIAEFEELNRILWRLTEKVSARLKSADLSAGGITLKLKDTGFRIRTRSRKLPQSTQIAELLYRAAADLLRSECDGTEYRLIGIGTHDLHDGDMAPTDMLAEEGERKARLVEDVIDSVRDRLGADAIGKGRGLPAKPIRPKD
ncbi:MAG: DNA polymerase IV [Hyphomicrobiales bacterium]|nr:DNA polymerase IV [Hyphomicrobiales bacterium]